MTTARLSYRLGGTDTADVLVVGAGLAGLNTAILLARQGHDVLLVERRTNLAGAIRTTGIFVRKTLDDFPLPPDCLGPPIRRVVLYPPDLRRPVSLTSPRDEYRVGDMGALYEATAATAVDAGVRIALGTRYTGRQGNIFHLAGRDGPATVRARFVVGADGARSRVARDLALDRNHHLIVGAEEVFELPGSDQPPTFHCVLDPSLAPGYLAWVINDGQHAHVGVAGYADRYPDGLRHAMEQFSASAPGLNGIERPEKVERRAGPIPVGGLLRRISCADGPRGRCGRRGLPAHRRRPGPVPTAVTARSRGPRRRTAHRKSGHHGPLRRSRAPPPLPRTTHAAPGIGPGTDTCHSSSGIHPATYAVRPGRGKPSPLRRQVLPDATPKRTH